MAMIKFFRKIRQNLLLKNQTGKYFKYAIGEIILVVIGILIALQINNWNEQNRKNALEGEYYCRLLEDAQQDLGQINQFIKLSEDRLAASNQAIRLLTDKEVKKVEIGKQLALSIAAIYSDFSPNDSAFEDLKSGANLNIIKDKTVTKAINNYFNRVKTYSSIIIVNATNALDVYNTNQDHFNSGRIHANMQLDRFVEGMEKDVYDAMTVDYKELLSEPMRNKLLNDALSYISANSRQLELYTSIKNEAISLLEVLKPKCKEND